MTEDRHQRITKAQFRDKNISIVLEISTCDILKCKMDKIILIVTFCLMKSIRMDSVKLVIVSEGNIGVCKKALLCIIKQKLN